jgi:hypothetical protein
LQNVYVAEERCADALAIAQLRLKEARALEPAENARMRRELAELMDQLGRSDEAAKQRRVAQTLEGMIAAHPPPV